jgi:hypothetical protein
MLHARNDDMISLQQQRRARQTMAAPKNPARFIAASADSG